MRRLGVTRTAAELVELEAQAFKSGISLVALPTLQIHTINFSWPLDSHIGDDAWLFFTSANAVRVFWGMLGKKNITLNDKLRIAVVGSRTEAALSEFGQSADFIPSSEIVGAKALFAGFIAELDSAGVGRFGNVSAVVYISAETPYFDPAELFAGRSVSYQRIPVYRSVACRLPESVISEFTQEDQILYTSPKAAQSYAHQFGAPVAQALALGPSTALAIRELGWPEAVILAEPDIFAALTQVK